MRGVPLFKSVTHGILEYPRFHLYLLSFGLGGSCIYLYRVLTDEYKKNRKALVEEKKKLEEIRKALVEEKKRVSDFVDSEYAKNSQQLIALKTKSLNEQLQTKEFLASKAALSKAEEKHLSKWTDLENACNKLCREAVSIYSNYQSKLNAIYDILAQLDVSIALVQETFKENRFGPFWDAVQECFELLSECDSRFKTFKSIQVAQYYVIRNDTDCSNNLPHLQPPKFDIEAPKKTLAILQTIIRKAESLIEFATIYEIKTTRTALVRGFATTQLAIEAVGDQINRTIIATSFNIALEMRSLGEGLNTALENVSYHISSSIDEAANENRAALEEVIEVNSEMLRVAEQSEDSRLESLERLEELAREQVNTLDDIRRERIPTGPDPRKHITKPK